MNDKQELLLAVEKMNMEYIKLQNSKEFLLGKRVQTILELIKKGKIITLLKKIYELKKINKLLEYQNKENDEEDKLKDSYKISNDINKKVVVYTCVTGNYDVIQEPYIQEENVDYVLFTDNSKIKSNIWNIRDIPEDIKKFENTVIINRYIKMHPKELFPTYDYAYYIDGNVKIFSEITSLIDKISKNSGLAFHKHKARNCAYDEIEACILMKKGNKEQLIDTRKKFEKEQFPKCYGLLECNFFIVDINNECSSKILNMWWEEFYNSKCYRDQIYLPYVLWKNKIEFSNIGIIGENIYRNSKLRIVKHK